MHSATKAAAACAAACGTLPRSSLPRNTAPKISPVPWYIRGCRGALTRKLPPPRSAPSAPMHRPEVTPVSTTRGHSSVRRMAHGSAVRGEASAGIGSSSSSAASVRLGKIRSARAHRPFMALTISGPRERYSCPPSPSTGSTSLRACGHRENACSTRWAWEGSARYPE